jgi:hypothetical protein
MDLLTYVVKLAVDYGAHVVYLALLIIASLQARNDRLRYEKQQLELLERYHTQLHAMSVTFEELKDEIKRDDVRN